MKMINLKLIFNLLLIILLFGFVLINSGLTQELARESKSPATKEIKNGTRIVISTSGPAKFESYWLYEPSRLVIEFESRNILSKIGSEVMVNQGVIRKITSEYFGGDAKASLKSLTFELTQKVPYKIWQEANTILLDIQTPQELSVFSDDGSEVFAKSETKDAIVKRLEAMEAKLKQVTVAQASIEAPIEAPKLITKTSPPERKTALPLIFWPIGLTSIPFIGLLVWLFRRRYKLILDKNLAVQEISKLKTQLQEQNQLLEHEELIRKTIEAPRYKEKKNLVSLKWNYKMKNSF